jgi:hypothetical protein
MTYSQTLLNLKYMRNDYRLEMPLIPQGFSGPFPPGGWLQKVGVVHPD